MTDQPLAGKTAFVTGAAGGIGSAIALKLAQAGAAIAAVDCDGAALAALAQRLTAAGHRVLPFEADLAQTAPTERAASDALAALGAIDILVNCAGFTGGGAGLFETDEATWDRVQAINVKAPFLLMRAIGRHMAERGEGRIVNVTSSSAHRAKGSAPAYGSSKSALMQLTRSAAAELGPSGVNVNAIAPGLTRTRMLARFEGDKLDAALKDGPLANLLARVSEPEDIAEAALFLCLPASRQITAQTLHVSAGAIV